MSNWLQFTIVLLVSILVTGTESAPEIGHRRVEDSVCIDEPDIAYVNTLGVEGYPLPDGALVVTERGDGMIKFVVNQVWDMDNDLTLLAVNHHVSPSEPEAECEKNFDVSPNESTQYSSVCIDDIVAVSIFVYVGDGVDFEPESCAACEPADSSSDFVEYYMEINCNPQACVVDCPTDIEMYYQNGGSDDDRPIEILRQGNNTVTFRVLQPWYANDLDHLYIQYHNETEGGTDCVDHHEVSSDSSYVFTAYCMVTTPKTMVDIWVSNSVLSSGGSTDVEVPQCCHPPSVGDANAKIQYSFLLNCETSCSPDSTDESADEPDDSEESVDEVCDLSGGTFPNMFESMDTMGFVDSTYFIGQGIKITATSFMSNTLDIMPRILDTNPINPSMLPDKEFGSPNESCNVPGPGIGQGGMGNGMNKNCDALGPVMIIPKEGTMYPESNPSGGSIHIEFTDPETLMSLVLFNLGISGAIVTVDTTTETGINKAVPFKKANAVQTIPFDLTNVKKITIRFNGVGALAGMTLCRDFLAL